MRNDRLVIAGEDTVVDLQAGTNAGVLTLGLHTGALNRAQLEEHAHAWVLDGVADLPRRPQLLSSHS